MLELQNHYTSHPEYYINGPAWTNEEKARLLASAEIYIKLNNGKRKGVWTQICKNTIYGFFLNRTREQLRDANNRIFKSSDDEIMILETAAAKFDPLLLTTENLKEILENHEIEIDSRGIDILDKLHRNDLNEYKTEIGSMELEEISKDDEILSVDSEDTIHSNISESIELNQNLKMALSILEENIVQRIKAELNEIKSSSQNLNYSASLIDDFPFESEHEDLASKRFRNSISTNDNEMNEKEHAKQVSELELDNILLKKIFEMFRYRKVSLDSIHELANSDKMFTDFNIEDFLEKMVNKQCLSKINKKEYKTNMKISDAICISFESVIQAIKSELLESNKSIFSQNKISHSYGNERRPSKDVLSNYFEDLIADGIIEYEKKFYKVPYYSLHYNE